MSFDNLGKLIGGGGGSGLLSTLIGGIGLLSEFEKTKDAKKRRKEQEARLKRQEARAFNAAKRSEAKPDRSADISLGSSQADEDNRRRGRRSIASQQPIVGGFGSLGGPFTGGL